MPITKNHPNDLHPSEIQTTDHPMCGNRHIEVIHWSHLDNRYLFMMAQMDQDIVSTRDAARWLLMYFFSPHTHKEPFYKRSFIPQVWLRKRTSVQWLNLSDLINEIAEILPSTWQGMYNRLRRRCKIRLENQRIDLQTGKPKPKWNSPNNTTMADRLEKHYDPELDTKDP